MALVGLLGGSAVARLVSYKPRPSTVHLRSHHDGRAGHHAAQCGNYEKQISPDKPAFTGERTAIDRVLSITGVFS